MFIFHLTQNQLHVFSESHVQHLVCLIQHHHIHIIQLDGMAAHMIHDAPRRPHDDLSSPQAAYLFPDILASIHRKHSDPLHIFCNFSDFFCRLHSQFPGRAEDNRLQLLQRRIDLLQSRNSKSRCLSCSCLSLSNNVFSIEQPGNRHLLNRGQLVKSHLLNRPDNSFVQQRFNVSQTAVLFSLRHSFHYNCTLLT